MSLIQTSYNRHTGLVSIINPRTGMYEPGDITYTDDLPPTGKPVRMAEQWTNRFTEQVLQAVVRSGGNSVLDRFGLSTSIEGEFRYEFLLSNGQSHVETTSSLAAIYQQTPGKWPAVAAHLDRVLNPGGAL